MCFAIFYFSQNVQFVSIHFRKNDLLIVIINSCEPNRSSNAKTKFQENSLSSLFYSISIWIEIKCPIALNMDFWSEFAQWINTFSTFLWDIEILSLTQIEKIVHVYSKKKKNCKSLIKHIGHCAHDCLWTVSIKLM